MSASEYLSDGGMEIEEGEIRGIHYIRRRDFVLLLRAEKGRIKWAVTFWRHEPLGYDVKDDDHEDALWWSLDDCTILHFLGLSHEHRPLPPIFPEVR